MTDTIKDTDCRLPDGHRYDASGRCEWCDAERGDDPKTTAQQASKRLLDSMFDAARAARSLEHHDAWVTLITQAEDALQAMWDTFGDLSDNEMLGMPCRDALVKCRDALAAIDKAKEGTDV